MKMTLMGTGTSHGIPVIGCSCPVCSSPDPRDKRLRCSAFIENEEKFADDGEGNSPKKTSLVIDTGPEFRIQCLKFGVKNLDGVFITHAHADHCFGLDDLRVFSYRKLEPVAAKSIEENNPAIGKNDIIAMNDREYAVRESDGDGLPIYSNAATLERIIFTFPYIFNNLNVGGGVPKLNLKTVENLALENPLKIGSVEAIPIPLIHGKMVDTGWLLRNRNSDGKYHSIAYLTDCSYISDESIELIRKACGVLEHLVIDSLRVKPHPTHCSFDQSLAYAEKIGAVHTWFTHICHDTSHDEIQKYIDENLRNYPQLEKIVSCGGSVSPAYDGLVIEA